MRILFVLALISLSILAQAQTFTATLTGPGVIKGGTMISTEPAISTATFELTTVAGAPDATELAYSLSVSAFDIDGTKTADLGDDITAVHLHTLTDCAAPTCVSGDTAGTKHVLNIFGVPREDDSQLAVDLTTSTISGIWDPTDVNALSPAPGQNPNDYLDELANRQLFIMIHTRDFSAGAVGGILVPEPGAGPLAWMAIGMLGLTTRRCRTPL